MFNNFLASNKRNTENFDKRAVNCNRLQLRLAESCPTQFLKSSGNSFPCQETLLYCKPASVKKDQYQGAVAEILAALKPSWVFTTDSCSIHLSPLHQAIRAGLMDYILNYQQASPTDGLLPKLKTEFG